MKTTLLALLIALFVTTPCLAQAKKKDIYANPQNLKVLPKDISSSELGDTMKSFAMGLGMRCETCHVGEPNTPLDTFDFESDEKAMKQKARVMIKMVNKINDRYVPKLNKIEDSERVEVRCVTCHRGQPQPKLIQDVLDMELAENGTDSAVDVYKELRTKYYGSHSYDFSEFALPIYAQTLVKRDQTAAAIALTKLNAEYIPESYFSHFVLGELYKLTAQNNAAIASYKRAAELNPRAKVFLDPMIAELEAQSE